MTFFIMRLGFILVFILAFLRFNKFLFLAMPMALSLAACASGVSLSNSQNSSDVTGVLRQSTNQNTSAGQNLMPVKLPKNLSVALLSVRGSETALGDRFTTAFNATAHAVDLPLGDSQKAQFFLRGYVTQYADSDGANFAVVLDVYDAKKAHSQRIANAWTLLGKTSEAVVDEATLQTAVNQTVEDLSHYLAEIVLAMDTQPTGRIPEHHAETRPVAHQASLAAKPKPTLSPSPSSSTLGLRDPIFGTLRP